jgi:hypothetical protein
MIDVFHNSVSDGCGLRVDNCRGSEGSGWGGFKVTNFAQFKALNVKH